MIRIKELFLLIHSFYSFYSFIYYRICWVDLFSFSYWRRRIPDSIPSLVWFWCGWVTVGRGDLFFLASSFWNWDWLVQVQIGAWAGGWELVGRVATVVSWAHPWDWARRGSPSPISHLPPSSLFCSLGLLTSLELSLDLARSPWGGSEKELQRSLGSLSLPTLKHSEAGNCSWLLSLRPSSSTLDLKNQLSLSPPFKLGLESGKLYFDWSGVHFGQNGSRRWFPVLSIKSLSATLREALSLPLLVFNQWGWDWSWNTKKGRHGGMLGILTTIHSIPGEEKVNKESAALRLVPVWTGRDSSVSSKTVGRW